MRTPRVTIRHGGSYCVLLFVRICSLKCMWRHSGVLCLLDGGLERFPCCWPNLVANLEHPHLVLPTPLLQFPGCGGGLSELVGSLHGSSCCRGSACRNLGEHRWALTHKRYHRRTKSCQRSITLLCSTVVCPYALLTKRRPILFTQYCLEHP